MKTKSLEIEVTEEEILAWILDRRGFLPSGDEDAWIIDSIIHQVQDGERREFWSIVLASREQE